MFINELYLPLKSVINSFLFLTKLANKPIKTTYKVKRCNTIQTPYSLFDSSIPGHIRFI